MKEIPLTQGKVAIIDDIDFESVSRHGWFAHFDGCNYYAMTKTKGKNRRNISLHSFLMKPPKGVEIDHRDNNSLNNRRNNLRICTHAQNMKNRGMSRVNKSGFKGVSWKKKNKRWVVQIHSNGRVLHLGLFDDKKEAAMAYDAAAEKHFGEFAMTNKKLGLI